MRPSENKVDILYKEIVYIGTEAYMEINKCSALGVYNKIESGYKSAKKDGKTVLSSAKKVDTLEISSAARANIESAKAAAGRFAQADASPDRIDALKAKIADGTYSISPENVAAAIFEG